MVSSEEIYANRIFLNSVLPLVKVLVENKDNLSKKFAGKTAKIQVSANDPGGKVAAHFIIEKGVWTVGKGLLDKPDLELEFKSISQLNSFFAGKSKKLPRIIGWHHLSLVIGFFSALLTMAKMLNASEIPASDDDKELMVRLYFYLLSSGISQLNKAGHPEVSNWARKSPDRVYAWEVTGNPELAAYIQVKAGNTRAARGQYTRSKLFFTMCFSSPEAALGILLQKDDMIAVTIDERLIMEGAPEYGAQIGEFMMMVGSFAK